MNFAKRASKIVCLLCLALVITVLSLGSVGAAGDDDLLGKYETGDKEFTRHEIGDVIVYGHQRMIDEAIVGGDYIRYVFDKNTGELVEKDVHWRDDLPEHLPPVISREEAESMVEGEIQSSKLKFISPDSPNFPIEPTPKNPCWVVWVRGYYDNQAYVKDIIVIDAVEGKIVGNGVPPPSGGYVLSGPMYLPPYCSGYYQDLFYNARNWFEEMGCPTDETVWPSEEEVKSYIQNNEIAMFYEVAHSCSGDTGFKNACYDCTTASEVEDWIEDYAKMPFTFLASCDGMCNTGSGTLSYEFRKGSMENTATVGYCGMSHDPCEECWEDYSLHWQQELFEHMAQGDTVKEAFDEACIEYWQCVDCMRFAGDEDFAVMPIVQRQGVKGKTGTVRCDNLTGVTIWLWRQGWPEWVEVATSNEYGYYGFCVSETGDYGVAATKSGFRWESQDIDITNLEEVYELDFRGEYGLVPNAPSASYAMDCVNHWLFPPSPECGLSASRAMDVVNAWLFPRDGKGAEGGEIQPLSGIGVNRFTFSSVRRGQTFQVWVGFIAPADDFNAIALTDFAPEGWDVTVRARWSDPDATAVKATDNKAEITWYGPYDENTWFSGNYKVTVPEDATLGVYTFGDGFLKYYIAGDGPYTSEIGGVSQVEVVG